jgi:hypothetical protein
VAEKDGTQVQLRM